MAINSLPPAMYTMGEELTGTVDPQMPERLAGLVIQREQLAFGAGGEDKAA